jgi:hypothetical protein
MRYIDDSSDVVSECLRIEKILKRANEIHRSHGGLFGYDLEDWLAAEREMVERSHPWFYNDRA